MTASALRTNKQASRRADKDFQTIMSGYVSQCRTQLGTTVPLFGPSYGDADGSVVADSLFFHRLSKGFEKPNNVNAKTRKENSILEVIQRDAAYSGFKLPSNENDLRALNHSRKLLWKLGADFRREYDFRAPSGESALSAHGYVDLEYKLNDWENWECSPENREYAIEIAYRNTTLRKSVKIAYRKFCAKRGLDYVRVLTVVRAGFLHFGPVKNLPRLMFGYMFRSVVRINGCSRMSTVPKNNNKDRVITMEPFWDMVCQLSFMLDMRRVFEKATGIDLNVAQDHHKLIIMLCDDITVDLSKASDSVYWDVVCRQFHPNMVSIMESLRTPVTEYEVDGVTCFHYFNMLAPMGCGITFDVMTWLLWSVCSYYDSSARVFGDDIIVRRLWDGQETFPYLRSTLESLGLQINTEKSFTSGQFRESCGGFHHTGVGLYEKGNLVSFDFTWPASLHDRFVTLNKLARIYWAGQVTKGTRSGIRRVWFQLLRHVPADAVWDYRNDHLPDGFVMSLWGSHPGIRPKGRQVEIVKCLRQHWQRKIRLGAIYLQVPATEFSGNAELNYRLSLRSGERHKPSPRGKVKTVRLVAEVESRVPIRDIPLVSVLPT